MNESSEPLQRPASPRELFIAFSLLALQGFGGVLAVAQRVLVEERRWLTREEFLEVLAVGQMNSILVPTIVSLACEKLGARAADGSGIINIAIFGGAAVPLLTGMLADASGSLAVALALPAACYVVIAGFGFYARRPA